MMETKYLERKKQNPLATGINWNESTGSNWNQSNWNEGPPWWSSGKESTFQCRGCRFNSIPDPWSGN